MTPYSVKVLDPERRFWVCSRTTIPPTPQPPAPTRSLAKRTNVWIVDDSPLDAERARLVLDGHYEVQVFGDGSAVLEQLSSQAPPDVLVLDWVMPGVSGIEVCRFLRSAHRRQRQLSILLLTTQTQTQQ